MSTEATTLELLMPADDPDEELELRFLGPLVTVRNVEDHLPLYAHVFGLEARAIQELDAAEVRSLWGVERGAGSVLLETGDSGVGVRLVQFERRGERHAPDAWAEPQESITRDLRFLTRDFEVARHLIERAGFSFRSISRFSAAGLGRFTEARLQGPDGVSISVLRLHDHDMKPWVRVADRLFGELLSVAIGVAEVDAAAAFFELLGLHPVSFGASAPPAGAAAPAPAPGVVAEAPAAASTTQEEVRENLTFGSAPRAPMITVVAEDTGSAATSTLEEALVARPGVVALRFECADVERVRRRLWSAAGQRTGARVLSLGRGILEPHGPVESMMVRGPGGVVHQFVGRM